MKSDLGSDGGPHCRRRRLRYDASVAVAARPDAAQDTIAGTWLTEGGDSKVQISRSGASYGGKSRVAEGARSRGEAGARRQQQ